MISERLHGLGNFDVSLVDVPAETLQALTFDFDNPAHVAGSTLVVTPTWIDPDALGNADTGTAYHPLFDLAIYTGVLTDLGDDHDLLTGYGIAWHLGDHNDGGTVFLGHDGYSDPDLTQRWFQLPVDDWFDYMVNGGGQLAENGAGPNVVLTASELYGIDGVSTWGALEVPYFPDFLTRREILSRICDYIDALWYVTPNMVVTYGEQADLFPSPRCIIARGIESDPEWWTISTRPRGIRWPESIDGYVNRAVAFGDTESFIYPNTVSGTLSQDMFGPSGNPIRSVARDDADQQENVASWGARQQNTLGRRSAIRRGITIEGTPHEHGYRLTPGEPVWVYEPKVGLVDTSNEIHVAGRVLHPVSVDLQAVTWPVVKGMGVYLVYWDQTAGELAHIDLTRCVAFETGDTSLEVGAPSFTL